MLSNYRYISGEGGDFRTTVNHILEGYRPEGSVVRLVFFVAAGSAQEYLVRREIVAGAVAARFGSSAPVWSCVSQAPLPGGGVVVEAEEIPRGADCEIVRKSCGGIDYLIVESPTFRKLYLGGVTAGFAGVSFREHCDAVFAKIASLLAYEGMSASDIVRQWNYISGITAVEHGSQHYQDFNDSRSRFYESAAWSGGYPAATGIGSAYGGLVIDLEAVRPLAADAVVIRKIDNKLQVSAFDYSQEVLAGGCGSSSTPKFERAKAVLQGGSGVVYISGTAAIRGEQSLAGVGIGRQTEATLENMEYLISEEALREAGLPCGAKASIAMLRVYVKNPDEAEQARRIVSARHPGIPAVCLHADVCRENLLVEIEGVAAIR